MLQRAILILIAMFVMLPPVSAQDCAAPEPGACRLFGAAAAIFVGEVTENNNDSGTVRFQVTEAFKGVSGTFIEILGAPFSPHFAIGEKWLVFANNCIHDRAGKGCLTVGPCSLTRRVESAAAILDQLRIEQNGGRDAAVYGVLNRTLRFDQAIWDESYITPLSGIHVRLKSDGRVYDANTDDQGAYAFRKVASAKYEVSADLPSNLELGNTIGDDTVPPVTLPRHTCFENNLYALPTGGITGRVIGPDGKPLDIALVNLFRADRYAKHKPGLLGFQGKPRRSDESQPFRFYHLPTGDYILVFNALERDDPDEPFPITFFPSTRSMETSQLIHLRDGQKVTGADIHVSNPLPTRQITVQLNWVGKEPQDYYPPLIFVKASRGTNPLPQEISPDRFALNLFLDSRYTLHAEAICKLARTGKSQTSKSSEATIDGNNLATSEVTLSLNSAGCGRK